ncbi:hypothetical protein J2Z44_000448 [Clostridium punense]|uniref:DUF4830 domain-containing protein n=1 Tax=Clostridium punense TaxID=1054297 RepID=A0ABS4JYQ0_9CLOT|nr:MULTISPECIES: DUF4830 domain-containing protein [Clostridium]EQB87592.1 hypothetical protein M918_08245 [Clostridium sp. BL8]MBP2020664.1 hypothetical protein [Clostridium punense]
MKCNEENLYDYIENKLDDEKLKMVEEHIRVCKKCTEVLNTFKLMESIGETPFHASSAFTTTVMSKIDKDLYSRKRYFYLNKIIENKRKIVKYTAVAVLAFAVISIPMFSEKFNLVGNLKNNNLVKVQEDNVKIDDIDEKSKNILLKYNYHIEEKISEKQIVLNESFGSNLETEASKEIGLDLSQYKRKEVKQVTYTLKEKTKDNFNGSISAILYYNDKNELIGGFLSYDGYTPGIFPINSRSEVIPEGFEPQTFKFESVESIELIKFEYSNGENLGVEKRSTITRNLEKFLAALETSKPINKEFNGKKSVENQYMICINYKDKAVLRLYYYKDINKIDITGLNDWHYETTDELRALVEAGGLTKETTAVSKKDLRNKITNSVDYFSSAQGIFRLYEKRLNSDVTVDYKVKLKDIPSSYEKETSKDGTIVEATLNENKKTIFDNNSKTFRVGDVSVSKGGTARNDIEATLNEDKRSIFDKNTKTFRVEDVSVSKRDTTRDNIENRYGTASDGSSVGYLRRDPLFLLYANESLFNQNLAVGILKDESKWSISAIEKYLDLDAAIIEGTLDNYYSVKFASTKYKIWVEKNTGIVLKTEWYDENGVITKKLETTSIKLNIPIDDKEMKKDITGYTESN